MPAFCNPGTMQPGWYGGRSSKPPVGVGSSCDAHRIQWWTDEQPHPNTCDSFGQDESPPGFARELTLFAHNEEQANAFAAMYPGVRVLFVDDKPR